MIQFGGQSPSHGNRQQDYEKQIAYRADVRDDLTGNEFGFDHLRDSMKDSAFHRLAGMCTGRFRVDNLDEVDSILIDEARTPLIISGRRRLRRTSMRASTSSSLH